MVWSCRVVFCGGLNSGVGITAVRASGKGVRLRLFPGRTPKAMTGFRGLVGGKFCSKLAFREMVPGFMVRNKYPGKGKANNPNCAVGYRARKGPRERKANTLSVTRTKGSANKDRFFVARDPRPRLSKMRAMFNRIVGNRSIIGTVHRNSGVGGMAIRREWVLSFLFLFWLLSCRDWALGGRRVPGCEFWVVGLFAARGLVCGFFFEFGSGG